MCYVAKLLKMHLGNSNLVCSNEIFSFSSAAFILKQIWEAAQSNISRPDLGIWASQNTIPVFTVIVNIYSIASFII